MIYFPGADIAKIFWEPSQKTTTCPLKTDGSKYVIVAKNRTLPGALWSYGNSIETTARYRTIWHSKPGDNLLVEHISPSGGDRSYQKQISEEIGTKPSSGTIP